MNSILIDVLSFINGLLAAVIIGFCAVYGLVIAESDASLENLFGLLFGGIVGVVTAAVICGLVAALIQIERHLRVLARDKNSFTL